MAKPRSSDETEVEVTLMRKVSPEHFDVVVGTVKGPLVITKTLEKSVSLMVGRGTARTSMRRQHMASAKAIGLTEE